jgi:hypothetical protein
MPRRHTTTLSPLSQPLRTPSRQPRDEVAYWQAALDAAQQQTPEQASDTKSETKAEPKHMKDTAEATKTAVPDTSDPYGNVAGLVALVGAGAVSIATGKHFRREL